MSDSRAPDRWPKGPFAEDKDQTSRPLQTVEAKFLDAVRSYAEERYLELVVDLETPSSGYGYIQKKEGFSNLYSFHFEFSSASATFYLGTEKVATAAPEQRRKIEFSGAAQLEDVLTEIRAGIDSASKVVFPGLTALSAQRDVPAPAALGALQTPATRTRDVTTDHRDAAMVWGQDEKGTRAEMRDGQRRGSPWPRRGVIVAILVVGVLLFVPLFGAQGCPTNCGTVDCGGQATCPASGSYNVSVTNHYFGVGGEYFPPGKGWTLHEFFGVTSNVDGSKSYGFAFWHYYFAS
jgi:hypothetical protein